MLGCSLLSLDPIFLEKVLTKVNWKSCFALQQTCRSINEIIRNSRRISIQVKGTYQIVTDGPSFHLQLFIPLDRIDIDDEGLYGARLKSLYLGRYIARGNFQSFCKFLKKYRLTCEEVTILNVIWTKKEYMELLKLLKPIKIGLFCYQSQPEACFEILVDIKTLKNVKVWLREFEAITAVRRLLPLYPELKFEVTSSQEHFNLLRMILQILRSGTWPTLRTFRFGVHGMSQTSPDDFEEQFGEVNRPPRVTDVSPERFTAVVELPEEFPQGSQCKMVVERHQYNICYQARARLHCDSL